MSAPFLYCLLPFSITSEITFDNTAFSSIAAKYNKSGAPESAAVNPEEEQESVVQ